MSSAPPRAAPVEGGVGGGGVLGGGVGGGGSPVESALPNRSASHPYSSVALSPDRLHAVVAGKDLLRIVAVGGRSRGLSEVRSLRVAQHFTQQQQQQQQQQRKEKQKQKQGKHGDVRDAFQPPPRQQQAATAAALGAWTGANITVNDVAWSLPQGHPRPPNQQGLDLQQSGAGVGVGAGAGGAAKATPGGPPLDGASPPPPPPPPPPGPGRGGSGGGGGGGDGPSAAPSADAFDARSGAAAPHGPATADGPNRGDSLIAAAGSNGAVVVWRAKDLMGGSTGASIGHQPEAVLVEHSRAVNRLAWHPTGRRPGLLLTASQDATVRLWERRVGSAARSAPPAAAQEKPSPPSGKGIGSWFGRASDVPEEPADRTVRSYSWRCVATFHPKADAARDVKWSPYNDDVFAMVTDNGTLLVYDIRVTSRPWIRLAAHAGEASCLDWHPTRRYHLATGGGRDRSVKVWDLEDGLNLSQMGRSQENARENARSSTSERSADSEGSPQDGDPLRGIAGPLGTGVSPRFMPPHQVSFSKSLTAPLAQPGSHTWGPLKRSLSTGPLKSKSSPITRSHILSVSSPITRLEWRPEVSSRLRASSGKLVDDTVDRHDAMLAVTTAPISGASAGGSGSILLLSWHRPFMPLSVVEGHKDGAVTDFVWLDFPFQPTNGFDKERGSSRHEGDDWVVPQDTLGTWQHVLSVGRDGNCLIQSLEKGERPISRVPPSTFAVANLSPFQTGFGSLQIVSVHQQVPSGFTNDFELTGLKSDAAVGASSPGGLDDAIGRRRGEARMTSKPGGQREPKTMPELVFSVTDKGDLDEYNTPSDTSPEVISIAGEVQHMSRFAYQYKLKTDADYPSIVDLCICNAMVADGLKFESLAHMWRMLASILEGAGAQSLSAIVDSPMPTNPMAFVLFPTLKSILIERADAGDVQTCVVICEVMGVVVPPVSGSDAPKVLVPGLSLDRIREWYLSYIDLLQQMCLFSPASELIGSCPDPAVSALSQQSTTLHEACPQCGKPIESVSATDGNSATIIKQGDAAGPYRTCKRCRMRVGQCFLCHEVVKGMYVWCPGCGHGGCLAHALEWFGDNAQEFCPTGCGHKCNMLQRIRPELSLHSMRKCIPAS